MISLGDLWTMDKTISVNNVWVCGECGNTAIEQSIQMDEEDIWNLIQNHKQELGKTKIFKELKKELGED